MLIGIDGRAFYGAQAGTGRYVLELCKVLDLELPSASFYVYGNKPLNFPLKSPRWSQRGVGRLTSLLPSSIWYFLFAGRMVKNDKCDLFWGAANFLPFGLCSSIVSILTIHDFVFRLYPKTLTLRNRIAYLFFFRNSLKCATAITTNSVGTANRLREFYQVTASSVVRPSASNIFRPPLQSRIESVLDTYCIQQPYFIAVATLEPRKNIEALVAAFTQLRIDNHLEKVRLVLVGQQGWKDSKLINAIAHAKLMGAEVLATGYVPDETLPALYKGSLALVMPSLYEGFGMPVLEAKNCGARIVATNIQEIREAGGEGVIYVEPTIEGIKAGLLLAYNSIASVEPNRSQNSSWAEEGAKLVNLVKSIT
jgi:glycosyltransferase involved in cell wall biosynthesis